MKTLFKIVIPISATLISQQVAALCIGPCTPDYSPMHINITDVSTDAPIGATAIAPVQEKTQANSKIKHTTNHPITAVKNNPTPIINNSNVNDIPLNATQVYPENTATINATQYRFNKLNNTFNFSLYKPTYILPIFYNTNPDQAVYYGNTPDNQSLTHSEVDYQLSFKVPVWQNIFSWPDTLYAAYTQDSYWQLYTNSPYFRETNYQPELFLDNEINLPMGGDWNFSDLDIGAMHQSNGRGGPLERSWNRAYFSTIMTNDNWMISIQPWTPIFAKESSDEHNPDITHYLGYGQETIAYNWDENTFSFVARNVLESGFSRGAEWLTWSFPLLHKNVKGYVYLFSGYGYDLIDYNHYTNGAGLGITLNDWI